MCFDQSFLPQYANLNLDENFFPNLFALFPFPFSPRLSGV